MSQTNRTSARRRRREPVPAPTVHTGTGEPLLLLHPFTTSHDVWAEVVPTLAQEHEVVAATLPGHWGGPPLRRRDVSLQAYADGVETLLDELGWDTCHLAGNSIGGWLAFELAQRGRARSVTAIAPAGSWTKWSREEIVVAGKFAGLYAAALLGHALGERALDLPLHSLVLKTVSHHPRRVSRERADNFVRAASRCPSFLPFILSEVRSSDATDVRGLDREVPVRLVLCERDLLLPPKRYGAPYAAAMPDADVVTLADIGHIPMFEDPDLVAATILEHTRAHAALRHADTA
ncbi:alpha/beta fold hydrolase [Nocardioides litoris]|uniref:alpha/beta fold hydrolase n=1 Tax=Nocardioides litoris TaxID=1926648 RepID=UPI001123DFFD|nr:alpha/beta fold hydrolase [Nocardioides litoris]